MTTTITETEHTDDCTWIDHSTGNCGCRADAGLARIAEIKKEYADATPMARRDAIKRYLREQAEARRQAKAVRP